MTYTRHTATPFLHSSSSFMFLSFVLSFAAVVVVVVVISFDFTQTVDEVSSAIK